nr:radical SAM protein [Planctomycetota bacterium]
MVQSIFQFDFFALNEYRMDSFNDNLFNRRRQRHQSKLKHWRYAGLMLTYRCSAACRFCYYYCAPQAGGLMTTDTAINAWEGLIRLAGQNAKVHITGGEPFLYFDRLVEILQQAHRLGLGPVDTVETNASWGEHSSQITDKLRQLDALGLNRLKISWDPFHEEFIDIQSVRDLLSAARSVLGPDRVLVRWEKHLEKPSGIRGKTESERLRILQKALAADPCRLTGRAAETLATLAPNHPIEHFREKKCQNALLSAKGVHIDPYGNVFNGQCSGMVIGNITQTPLDVLWQLFEPD